MFLLFSSPVVSTTGFQGSAVKWEQQGNIDFWARSWMYVRNPDHPKLAWKIEGCLFINIWISSHLKKNYHDLIFIKNYWEYLLPFHTWEAGNVSPFSPVFHHFYPVILNSFPIKL
jgi:hypothetical protein